MLFEVSFALVRDFGPITKLDLEALQSTRTRLLDYMISEVENTIQDLRTIPGRFQMQRKACVKCGNLREKRRCRHCSTSKYYPLLCDPHVRVCDFIGYLESNAAWPLSKRRHDSAVMFLETIKSALPRDHPRCSKKAYCPLVERSELLESCLELMINGHRNVDFSPPRFEKPI